MDLRNSIDIKSQKAFGEVQDKKERTLGNSFIGETKPYEDNALRESQLVPSPSIVSQGAGTRMDSVYGDEMDDGSRGVRHGFGV